MTKETLQTALEALQFKRRYMKQDFGNKADREWRELNSAINEILDEMDAIAEPEDEEEGGNP